MVRDLFASFYAECRAMDLRHFGDTPGARLEIGSGSSFMADLYPDAIATDVIPMATTSAHHRAPPTWIVGGRMTSEPAPSVAAVVPAYRVAMFIADVVDRMPAGVDHVIVVDDASPDDTLKVLRTISDPRLRVLCHQTNQGVGGAMKTGLAEALKLGAQIVVKVDGDGQMDPALIPELIAPIVRGEADIVKGNRFAHLGFIQRIPMVRRVGNLVLSFLVKLASGYWRAFDPTNGYVAARAELLKEMDLARLADSYFYEISLLCEAYFARAVLVDIPMHPVYGTETSSLSPMRMVGHYTPRLVSRFFYRLFMAYFLRDFNVVSVFLVAGIPSFLFGLLWSLYHWVQASRTEVPTTTGTVMIGALAIVLGFQLILQAIVLDVESEPGRNRR